MSLFYEKIERDTSARFSINETTNGTLVRIGLVDHNVGYNSAMHVMASKGITSINDAKESLALDYITGKGIIYANKIDKRANQ